MAALAFFSLCQTGTADRLYHWVDSEGVSQISKEPPPTGVGSVDVMEYSERQTKPAKTAQEQSAIEPDKPKEEIDSTNLQKTVEPSKPDTNMATACYIQAGRQNVYLYVTEDRRPGGSSYQNILFKGDIASGQKILIRSTRGKIQFSYQREADDRAYGKNQAECVNGNVITIK